MNYRFKAIPTDYRSYEFRSRLEAKWAVFFDFCGWQWSYEPMDLDGWIPDFAIGEQATLVEVKPFFSREQWHEAIEKIERTSYDKPVVLLGADPTWFGADEFNQHQIGWVLGPNTVDDLHFGITASARSTNDDVRISLCPINAPISVVESVRIDIMIHEIWHGVTLTKPERESILVRGWAKACNVSKWEPTK